MPGGCSQSSGGRSCTADSVVSPFSPCSSAAGGREVRGRNDPCGFKGRYVGKLFSFLLKLVYWSLDGLKLVYWSIPRTPNQPTLRNIIEELTNTTPSVPLSPPPPLIPSTSSRASRSDKLTTWASAKDEVKAGWILRCTFAPQCFSTLL